MAPFALVEAFPFVPALTTPLFFAAFPKFTDVLAFLREFALAVVYTLTGVLDFTGLVAFTSVLPLADFSAPCDRPFEAYVLFGRGGAVIRTDFLPADRFLRWPHSARWFCCPITIWLPVPCFTAMLTRRTTEGGRHILVVIAGSRALPKNICSIQMLHHSGVGVSVQQRRRAQAVCKVTKSGEENVNPVTVFSRQGP